MKSAQELRESIQAARTEIEAIVAVATEEQRELSDEEQSATDDNLENIKKHEKALASREKIDQQIKLRAAAKLEPQIEAQLDSRANAENLLASIRVPAKAKAHGDLKAFKGEDAERNAYVAGQVCLAGMYGHQGAIDFCRDRGLVLGSMQEGQGQKGGFLVPDEMQQALVRLREERGVFERYARTIPMGSDSITINRELADITAYWLGEGTEITDSDVTIGTAELIAKKLGALTKISSELDEDAVVEIGDMVTRSMAYKMADKIDEAGFNGDGTSSYGGVTGLKNALDSNAVHDAVSGNVGADSLDLSDFESTVGKLPQYPGITPAWFVHSAVYWASMGRLMNASGGNTTENLGSGPVRQFLGYPVVFAQVLPSTTGDSASTILGYFGDLSLAATVGRRRSMNTQVSVDRYFEQDMIGLRATQRIAINVHERGDTIRTRPMIALKTAAS